MCAQDAQTRFSQVALAALLCALQCSGAAGWALVAAGQFAMTGGRLGRKLACRGTHCPPLVSLIAGAAVVSCAGVLFAFSAICGKDELAPVSPVDVRQRG